MTLRLVVALALAVAVALLTWRYRRSRAAATGETAPALYAPALPAALTDGADRTWVIFTTPYCASCGPVEAQLRAADPDARLIRVDATRDAGLAGAYRVRTAPTALLADGDGTVQAKLVGAAAVSRYLTDRAR